MLARSRCRSCWSASPAIRQSQALRRAVYEVSLPNRVVMALPPGEELPADHPAHGKGLVEGRPAAYICDGPVCSLPVTDREILLAKLSEQR